MPVEKIFRALIYATLTLLVAGVLAGVFAPGVPEEISDQLDAENNGLLAKLLDSDSLPVSSAVLAVLIVFLCLWIASLVGMLGFRRWARAMFILLTPIGVLLEGVMGASVVGPAEAMVGTAYMMCQGALLVLLFVDPVRSRFLAAPVLPAPGV
jgi:hypothetical protein